MFILPGFLCGARAGEPLARALVAAEAEGLASVLVVSISLRGRGNSASGKEVGYSISHHIRDIEAVRADLGLCRIGLCAFSATVPYAIGYALDHPERVGALILGDYPPFFRKIPDSWVESIEAEPWLFANWQAASDWATKAWSVSPQDFQRAKHQHFVELPSGEVRRSFARELPRALQTETSPLDFSSRLHDLPCPILVLRGTLEGSLLPSRDAILYQKAPNAKVVEIPCGHSVFDHPLAVRSIVEFLSTNVQ